MLQFCQQWIHDFTLVLHMFWSLSTLIRCFSGIPKIIRIFYVLNNVLAPIVIFYIYTFFVIPIQVCGIFTVKFWDFPYWGLKNTILKVFAYLTHLLQIQPQLMTFHFYNLCSLSVNSS